LVGSGRRDRAAADRLAPFGSHWPSLEPEPVRRCPNTNRTPFRSDHFAANYRASPPENRIGARPILPALRPRRILGRGLSCQSMVRLFETAHLFLHQSNSSPARGNSGLATVKETRGTKTIIHGVGEPGVELEVVSPFWEIVLDRGSGTTGRCVKPSALSRFTKWPPMEPPAPLSPRVSYRNSRASI